MAAAKVHIYSVRSFTSPTTSAQQQQRMSTQHHVAAYECDWTLEDCSTTNTVVGVLKDAAKSIASKIDAEEVLLMARGQQHARLAQQHQRADDTSLLDRIARLPTQSIAGYFNVTPAYKVKGYNVEDVQLATALRNFCAVILVVLVFLVLVRLCCAHRWINARYRGAAVEKIPLDYRAQAALARARAEKATTSTAH